MCLKINISAAIKNAFSFAWDAKRVSIMFLTTLLTGLSLIFSIMGLIAYLSVAGRGVVSAGAGLVVYSLLLFVVLVLAAILSLLIKGLFIHNYTIRSVQGNLKKSVDALNGRILSLLALTVLVFLISSFLNILNVMPLLGTLANIVFSLAVFFAYQEVMLQKTGAIDAITNSYNIFKTSWKDILASFVVIFIIMMAVIFISIIPFMVAFISAIASIGSAVVEPSPAVLTGAIMNNIGLFIISGAIFVVGLSIANLFTTGFTTDVYLQLKGKKPAVQKAEKPKRTIAKKPAAKKMPARKKRVRKKKKAQKVQMSPVSENVPSTPQQVPEGAAVQ